MARKIHARSIDKTMDSPLKKIRIAQVTQGMYVQKICVKWMNHPFWKSSFMVADAKILGALRALGDVAVWIDLSKGLDVKPAISHVPALIATAPVTRPAVAPAPTRSLTDFGDDVAHAEAIRDRAKKVAMALFNEARLGKALSMGAAGEIMEEVDRAVTRNAAAMLSVLRLKKKDDYTYLHSVAVAALMIALGRRLGIEGDELKELGTAGLLHDIGKIGVPNAILNKPGQLSAWEMSSVRLHPQMGWDILRKEPGISPVALDVCLHHHEKTDGTGYPEKLAGDAISRGARMGAICDVYDAITSDRPYKKGWEPAEAIRRMAEWQLGHFDRDIFHAFVKLIGIYPTGTLVRLASQRLAVTLVQGGFSLLSPTVRILRALPSNEELKPTLVDLEHSQDSIVGIEDPVSWGINIPALLRA